MNSKLDTRQNQCNGMALTSCALKSDFAVEDLEMPYLLLIGLKFSIALDKKRRFLFYFVNMQVPGLSSKFKKNNLPSNLTQIAAFMARNGIHPFGMLHHL